MNTVDRSSFIGGSDIAAILGISPWKNNVDVWMEKTQPPIATAATAPQKWGTRLEPVILEWIKEDHQLEVIHHGRRHVGDPNFLRAEVDFEYLDAETGQLEHGEIKTVYALKAKEWGEENTDQVPLHYNAQMQWGMGITGARRCRAFALIGFGLKPYLVQRDDELISIMQAQAIKFWETYVIPKICPPFDYTDQNILDTSKRLYPGTNGRVIEANPDLEVWRGVIQQANAKIAHYDGVIKGAKAHLLAEMGENAVLKFSDGMAYKRKEVVKKPYTIEVPETRYIDFRLSKFKDPT